MISNEGATQGPSATSKMKRLGAGNDVITGGEFSLVIASLLELFVTPMKSWPTRRMYWDCLGLAGQKPINFTSQRHIYIYIVTFESNHPTSSTFHIKK